MPKTNTIIGFMLFIGLSATVGQVKSTKMSTNKSSANILTCSIEEGTCKAPGMAVPNPDSPLVTQNKPILVHYFTDPICSACWGIEPQLRRLKLEYGAYLDIQYHMGGLLPSWDGFDSGGIRQPADVAHHWDEVSAYYQMPIVGDLWLKDPLGSSFPPSIAFKAAQLQNPSLAVPFLRRLREMVFMEGVNIANWPAIATAALQVGLDTVQLKRDFDGRANEAFDEDLRITRTMAVRGFPTLYFTDADQNRSVIHGVKSYTQFEQAVMRLLPTAVKQNYDATTPEKAFTYYPSLTPKEFSVLSNQSLAAAEAALEVSFKAGKCTKFSTRNGSCYTVRTP